MRDAKKIPKYQNAQAQNIKNKKNDEFNNLNAEIDALPLSNTFANIPEMQYQSEGIVPSTEFKFIVAVFYV